MTDVLVDDHAEVDELLRGVMLAFDGGDVREVYPKLDYLWARLAVHIRAEHLHLFPALLSAAEGAGWQRRLTKSARWRCRTLRPTRGGFRVSGRMSGRWRRVSPSTTD